MHNEKLTLATLCGGAVQEKVDRALEKVARNILDPNTDPAKKRTVTLTITLKPNEDDTEDVDVSFDVKETLAPEMGVKTHMFINKDLKTNALSIMEHTKGEIRGQLDFGDVMTSMAEEKEKAGDDAAESVEEEVLNNIVDLRVKQG